MLRIDMENNVKCVKDDQVTWNLGSKFDKKDFFDLHVFLTIFGSTLALLPSYIQNILRINFYGVLVCLKRSLWHEIWLLIYFSK